MSLARDNTAPRLSGLHLPVRRTALLTHRIFRQVPRACGIVTQTFQTGGRLNNLAIAIPSSAAIPGCTCTGAGSIRALDPRLATSTVLPVLSEIVVSEPPILPGEPGYLPVRRAVLQSVNHPRNIMTEIEVTGKIVFNPARVEDYITDLTIEFDSAPVGRYDDRAKLGSIAKRTDNPGLLAFARDWVRNGIPTAGGVRIDWQHATWAQAKDALRLTYPAPDEAEQSAEILDDFTQTERTSQHSANWLRHREQAGAVIDLESESLLLKKAYSSTLSNYLPPSCRKHELESTKSNT